MTSAADDGWRLYAACHGRGTALWFPERGDWYGVAVAKAVCAGCGVRVACLDDALATEAAHETFGVRGGMSADERRRLPRRRATVVPSVPARRVTLRRRLPPAEPPLQAWTARELLDARAAVRA